MSGGNESVELVKEGETGVGLGHRGDFVEELALRSADTERKKYGNLWVLIQTDRILMTLGPDYVCFLVSFICFAIADYFLITFVNEAFEQVWMKIFNCGFALFQLFSYLLVAISNPGIALQQNIPSEQTQESDSETTVRYCLRCKIKMQRNMRHCKSCDVCIRNYDHHCPWVSKCIGGGNMKRFYVFVGVTPIYIMYFMVMIMVSSALAFAPNKK